VARRLDVHGSSACPGEHSHTVPAAPGWLACPLVAGAVGVDARGVDADGADPEPDPQAAASKDSTAARATPVGAPGRRPRPIATPPALRLRPHPDRDAQLGCISSSLAQVTREVNAGPRRLQARRPTSRLCQFANGAIFGSQ
jgi:hypothetical protein